MPQRNNRDGSDYFPKNNSGIIGTVLIISRNNRDGSDYFPNR
jgi:hypothetical protein